MKKAIKTIAIVIAATAIINTATAAASQEPSNNYDQAISGLINIETVEIDGVFYKKMTLILTNTGPMPAPACKMKFDYLQGGFGTLDIPEMRVDSVKTVEYLAPASGPNAVVVTRAWLDINDIDNTNNSVQVLEPAN